MKRKLIVGAVAAGLALAGTAGIADAKKPDNPGRGGQCVATGVGLLGPETIAAVAPGGAVGGVIRAHALTPSAFPYC